jgi:hypothetical protein
VQGVRQPDPQCARQAAASSQVSTIRKAYIKVRIFLNILEILRKTRPEVFFKTLLIDKFSPAVDSNSCPPDRRWNSWTSVWQKAQVFLLHAIHNPFYLRILKKTILFSGFRNPYKKNQRNKKTRFYSWLAFCRPVKWG